MTRRVITIDFSKSGIAEAIRELKEYSAEVRIKLHEVARRLAERGAEIARLRYSLAIYDGDNDVVVTYEEIPNGYKIMANGLSVCFIEFGAGAYYSGNTYPGTRPAGIVGIGEYGQRRGKGNGWYYKDSGGQLVFTRGNAPTAALFWTGMDLGRQAAEIAKEVFDK